MKVYEGTLVFKKLTRNMVVYGNVDLVAQYVPQKMFAARGMKKHPTTLIFSLSIPENSNRERKGGRRAKRKPKPLG